MKETHLVCFLLSCVRGPLCAKCCVRASASGGQTGSSLCGGCPSTSTGETLAGLPCWTLPGATSGIATPGLLHRGGPLCLQSTEQRWWEGGLVITLGAGSPLLFDPPISCGGGINIPVADQKPQGQPWVRRPRPPCLPAPGYWAGGARRLLQCPARRLGL